MKRHTNPIHTDKYNATHDREREREREKGRGECKEGVCVCVCMREREREKGECPSAGMGRSSICTHESQSIQYLGIVSPGSSSTLRKIENSLHVLVKNPIQREVA